MDKIRDWNRIQHNRRITEKMGQRKRQRDKDILTLFMSFLHFKCFLFISFLFVISSLHLITVPHFKKFLFICFLHVLVISFSTFNKFSAFQKLPFYVSFLLVISFLHLISFCFL